MSWALAGVFVVAVAVVLTALKRMPPHDHHRGRFYE